MNINKIEFQISIDDNKFCNKCLGKIDGKEGFIFILGKSKKHSWYDYGGYRGNRANLCMCCFNQLIKQVKNTQGDKREIYEKLVKEKEKRIKKKIINKLR